MRARLATALDDPNIRGADLAALSRRMLEIAKEIEAAHSSEEFAVDGSVADDAFDPEAI
ncbi:MAG: hypothetical protein Q7T56_07325 [Nocardioidaceae bacterium]|nr:hypothetical protein [Nocardioidaceae bacterium]